jgi:hypothetical protein
MPDVEMRFQGHENVVEQSTEVRAAVQQRRTRTQGRQQVSFWLLRMQRLTRDRLNVQDAIDVRTSQPENAGHIGV